MLTPQINIKPIEVTMHKDIDGFTVQHLPIITAYAHKLGVVDVINTLIPTQMTIDAGRVILGMILDTLTGRSPLYRLDKFFENKDTELLLGGTNRYVAFF